ncbi:hypothetical protein [Methylobacterium trifolii]|uniref:Uncharacterized protein n=1 Tax=Methylobacterium trifolii TaxID=1003092 RepID=A0ABQ4U5C0_9HYPH|nr:hypothetical protein [Methylobacterium trifolii]GJE62639.1 hypothetical protein MPOCJGCO_4772 [Methylobacterium trifolii]
MLSSALFLPVVEAALFTSGCLLIHTLRRHADVLTVSLACVATILILLIGISSAPEPFLKAQGADTLLQMGVQDFGVGVQAVN